MRRLFLVAGPLLTTACVAGVLWSCSSPRACDSPDDCFRGQICRSGRCVQGEMGRDSSISQDADASNLVRDSGGDGTREPDSSPEVGGDMNGETSGGDTASDSGLRRDAEDSGSDSTSADTTAADSRTDTARRDSGPHDVDSGLSERCDGADNDGDNVVDEGCNCVYDPNDPMNIDLEPNQCDDDGPGNGCGVCLGQTIDRQGNCTKPNEFVRNKEKSCMDGKDNDCDSYIDKNGTSTARKDFDCVGS